MDLHDCLITAWLGHLRIFAYRASSQQCEIGFVARVRAFGALNTVRAFQRVVSGNCAFSPTATVDSKTSDSSDVSSMVFWDDKDQVSAICNIYSARAWLETAFFWNNSPWVRRKKLPHILYSAPGKAWNCPVCSPRYGIKLPIITYVF